MQKLLRRTALAKRQAARRKAAQAGQNRSDNKHIEENQTKALNDTIKADRVAAKIARRENYFLGPLAPKRDVGAAKDTYGTISTRRLQGVEKGYGRWKNYYIKQGDRVVVVDESHRDRGKISTVRDVREKAEECTVNGINQVDIALPEYMLINDPDKRPIRVYEAPLPLSSVCLVHPLPHPETGALRDVVIKELRISRGDRYISGLDPMTKIPWPETEPEQHEDHDIDTLRIDVEERTWVPTLLRAPMPGSVIDELRNKYSKFRDRHDEEYLAKKMAEDERAQIKKDSVRLMMTPLQELHRKERAERLAKGQPTLSENTLAKIGEVMARNGIGGPTHPSSPPS